MSAKSESVWTVPWIPNQGGYPVDVCPLANGLAEDDVKPDSRVPKALGTKASVPGGNTANTLGGNGQST